MMTAPPSGRSEGGAGLFLNPPSLGEDNQMTGKKKSTTTTKKATPAPHRARKELDQADRPRGPTVEGDARVVRVDRGETLDDLDPAPDSEE